MQPKSLSRILTLRITYWTCSELEARPRLIRHLFVIALAVMRRTSRPTRGRL